MANKGGKSKKNLMGLLFFLGDAHLKQWQRGRWGWGKEFGTGEVAALLLNNFFLEFLKLSAKSTDKT